MSETDKIVSAILAAILFFVLKDEAKTPAEVVKKYRACCDSLELAQGDAEEKEAEKVHA